MATKKATKRSAKKAAPVTAARTRRENANAAHAPADPAPTSSLSPDTTDPKTGLPVGAILEYQALNRWRVHVPGKNQFGHGTTMDEAVADYFAPPAPVLPAPE